MNKYILNDIIKSKVAPGVSFKVIGVNENEETYTLQPVYICEGGFSREIRGQQRKISFNDGKTQYEKRWMIR
jgi:hypothetical protein